MYRNRNKKSARVMPYRNAQSSRKRNGYRLNDLQAISPVRRGWQGIVILPFLIVLGVSTSLVGWSGVTARLRAMRAEGIAMGGLAVDSEVHASGPTLGQMIRASTETEEFIQARHSDLAFVAAGYPRLREMPLFPGETGEENLSAYRIQSPDGSQVRFTLVPSLQKSAEQILKTSRAQYAALVAIDPQTGRVLAMAGRKPGSEQEPTWALRATFPAASLFKVLTSSAAVEEAGLRGDEEINYRGGDYTLSKANYQPNAQKDRKSMTLAEALGKSCNPVFARVALEKLAPSALERYARSFGFNSPIPFELPLQQSTFAVDDDDFNIARTAAGFGAVRISPIHAALISAALGNKGAMMVPYIVDAVYDRHGELSYFGKPEVFRHAVLPFTAQIILEMMLETTSDGTARRYFRDLELKYPKVKVAGKTGTLTGDDPEGMYSWFIATLPVDKPSLALAVMVINGGKSAALASRFVSKYLSLTEGAGEKEVLADSLEFSGFSFGSETDEVDYSDLEFRSAGLSEE